MTTGRNPILIGQAEEFDLVLPQVRAMIENEGVYICGDTAHPAFTVPLVSYDGKILSLVAEAELDPERFIPSFTAHGPYLASTHPDDFAVDRFAAALKAKLAKKRAGGMSGWDDKTACSEERLQTMLVEHVAKGDPVDVGNFAMMLFNRGESCAAPVSAPAEVPMPEPDLWLKQTSSAANPPHGWAVLFTPNGDASQVYLSSSMNIYGAAREAAGYARGLKEGIARTGLTPAEHDVLAERQRQMSVEGWTPEHDDEHDDGSLAAAAACYALGDQAGEIPAGWPQSWDDSWWRPSAGERRNLVKAGALILAEIERLDRAALRGKVKP